jgi:hypothetical protein
MRRTVSPVMVWLQNVPIQLLFARECILPVQIVMRAKTRARLRAGRLKLGRCDHVRSWPAVIEDRAPRVGWIDEDRHELMHQLRPLRALSFGRRLGQLTVLPRHWWQGKDASEKYRDAADTMSLSANSSHFLPPRGCEEAREFPRRRT